MMRRVLKVAALDVLVLSALVYVNQDLQWRSAYAQEALNRCAGLCSYAPSFSYGFLTQVFTMSGNSVQLASPPTLDWIQLLIYLLALLNGWLIYATMRSRTTAPRPKVPSVS
jgi:hypothetical protein